VSRFVSCLWKKGPDGSSMAGRMLAYPLVDDTVHNRRIPSSWLRAVVLLFLLARVLGKGPNPEHAPSRSFVLNAQADTRRLDFQRFTLPQPFVRRPSLLSGMCPGP